MNMNDLVPAIDDPVDSLLAFHRRTERSLATLGRLASQLDAGEMDAQASAGAVTLLHFFGESLPRHHELEERELIPLLERRIGAARERALFRELRGQLEADHRELHETWKRIRPALNAVGEGVARRLPVDLVQYFRAMQSLHISAEEAALRRAAHRWLLPVDRLGLARRISDRAAPRHAIVTPLPRD
jgi:pyridoxamine 5'-phosphate oxidase